MPLRTILQRVEATLHRWLLLGGALLALLVPAALMPESFTRAMLSSIASISVERIAGIAAATNALALMP